MGPATGGAGGLGPANGGAGPANGGAGPATGGRNRKGGRGGKSASMSSSKLIAYSSVEERHIIINACSKRYQQRININTSFVRAFSHGSCILSSVRMSSQYLHWLFYRLLGEVVAIVNLV